MPWSVHSGSESWDDWGRVFPDELHVSSFPDRFPHYAWRAAKSTHSDLFESRVYACLGVTCHLHFWQNDRGLVRATAVTRGVKRTPNTSQHTKLTLDKKTLPPLLPGFEPFDHESGALTNIQAPLWRVVTSKWPLSSKTTPHFRRPWLAFYTGALKEWSRGSHWFLC